MDKWGTWDLHSNSGQRYAAYAKALSIFRVSPAFGGHASDFSQLICAFATPQGDELKKMWAMVEVSRVTIQMLPDRVELSFSTEYDISDEDFEKAKRLEKNLGTLSLKYIDPPTPQSFTPRSHPNIWSQDFDLKSLWTFAEEKEIFRISQIANKKFSRGTVDVTWSGRGTHFIVNNVSSSTSNPVICFHFVSRPRDISSKSFEFDLGAENEMTLFCKKLERDLQDLFKAQGWSKKLPTLFFVYDPDIRNK